MLSARFAKRSSKMWFGAGVAFESNSIMVDVVKV
jgi:hypothetical protein